MARKKAEPKQAAPAPDEIPFADDSGDAVEPISLADVAKLDGGQMYAKVKPENGQYVAYVGMRKVCGSKAAAVAFVGQFQNEHNRPLEIDYSLD